MLRRGGGGGGGGGGGWWNVVLVVAGTRGRGYVKLAGVNVCNEFTTTEGCVRGGGGGGGRDP